MKFDNNRLARWARAVKKKDGGKCKKCGSRSNLHAHHKKQKSIHPGSAYALSNGTTLCSKCHHAWHKKHGYGKKGGGTESNRRRTSYRRGPVKRTKRIAVRIKKVHAKKKYNVKVRRR